MAQIASPISDVSIGTWTGSPTNTAGNRYQNIDESVRDDVDFVRSANDPANTSADFGLTSLIDPLSSSNHTFDFAYNRNTSGGGSNPVFTLSVVLLQGTTVIATTTITNISSSGYTTGSYTLTSGEADSITNYANLRVRFTANKDSGTRTAWIEVSWFQLQVPDFIAPAITQSRHRIRITT